MNNINRNNVKNNTANPINYMKILICTPSNTAIDLIGNKILQ